jgi:hypothetical protein
MANIEHPQRGGDNRRSAMVDAVNYQETQTMTTETVPQTGVSALAASPNSRPIFVRSIKINSLQAARIIDRSFKKLRHSLFQTSVIMKITFGEKEIEEIDNFIDKAFDEEQQYITSEKARVQAILDANDIQSNATYTKPKEYSLEIDSPRANRFLLLVLDVDKLITVIDTAWLSGEITDKAKKQLTFTIQQRLVKCAARIIGLESRTRAAAYKMGKGDEIAAEAPETAIHEETALGNEDRELDNELNTQVALASKESLSIGQDVDKPRAASRQQKAIEAA